jgi:hypothetical protein
MRNADIDDLPDQCDFIVRKPRERTPSAVT